MLHEMTTMENYLVEEKNSGPIHLSG